MLSFQQSHERTKQGKRTMVVAPQPVTQRLLQISPKINTLPLSERRTQRPSNASKSTRKEQMSVREDMPWVVPDFHAVR
jgi:hypothetical protein